MHDDLFDILCAWVVSRSDEGLGYTMGASKIAAMLLLNMQSPSAFLAMRNLIERHCLRSFFGGFTSKDDVSPPSKAHPLSCSNYYTGRCLLSV